MQKPVAFRGVCCRIWQSIMGKFHPILPFIRAALVVIMVLLVTLACEQAKAQSSTHEQLVSIQNPVFNQSLSAATVSISIHIYADASAQTWTARLNGSDIRGYFSSPSGCGAAPCDETASIPGYILSNGRNVLTATVSGNDSAVDIDRVEFVYSNANAAIQNPARRIPGVAVNPLVDLGGDMTNTANYQITVGPGPGFPTRIYTAAALDCSAGYNSAQVLVMDRDTLEPTTDGRNGQACFGTAAALTAFLQTLPAGRLVIANTFFGEMPNLDTSLIGGTNFVKSPAFHRAYSIIGVSGAREGEAYEGYGNFYGTSPNHVSHLLGSLMLDYSQHYTYVSSQYAEFELLPNQVGGVYSPTGSTIMFDGTPYVGTLAGSNDIGGFFLLEIDRRSRNVLSKWVYATNGPKAAVEISSLASRLSSSTSMFMLTTIGVPFNATSSVSADLFYAINALGGTGYVMPRLAANTASGQIPTYSLVSSIDSGYASNQLQVLEESNSFNYNPSSGAAQGLLARDRKNLWVVDVGTPEKFLSTGLYKTQASYGWKTVGFQPMQDWPTWTDAQQKVYSDLTDSDLYLDAVRDKMGCKFTPCQPIRSFYSSYLGYGIPIPSRIDYSAVHYVAGRGYTEMDFRSVVSQLQTERSYLANLQILYGQFTDTWDSTQTTLQVQLSDVARKIEEPLRDAQAQNELAASQLTRAANLIGSGSSIPVVGVPLSGLSAIFKAASAFTELGSQIPQEYSIKLDTLINDNQQIGQVLANSNNTFFLGIVSDWGKLQTIGQGYAAGNAPWYMCDECTEQRPPRTAIPMIALGAKRGYYRQLLPLVYTFDVFLQDGAPIPQRLGGKVGGVLNICETPYDQVGDRYLGYPSINVPSTYDFFIVTTTKRTFIDYSHRYIPYYPSESLMTDLFSPPSVTPGGLLSGGAGLLFDKFSSGPNKSLNMRNGLRPSDTPCVKDSAAATTDADFTISAPDSGQLVTNAGLTVTGQILLQEVNGFQGTATLACSGLSNGDVCSFSPSSVEFSQGQYATVKLTITTAPRIARVETLSPPEKWRPTAVLAFLACPLLIINRKSWRHLFRVSLATLAVVALCSSVSGCGGAKPVQPSPYPITSNVVVTATSGSLTHGTTIALTER